MEKTTDRPLVDGHATTCGCSTCIKIRGAQANTTPSGWAAPASHHPNLNTDYLRRIHWWVRLMGIVMVGPIAIAMIALVILVVSAALYGAWDAGS